jgi:hypothetical protein
MTSPAGYAATMLAAAPSAVVSIGTSAGQAARSARNSAANWGVIVASDVEIGNVTMPAEVRRRMAYPRTTVLRTVRSCGAT